MAPDLKFRIGHIGLIMLKKTGKLKFPMETTTCPQENRLCEQKDKPMTHSGLPRKM